MPQAIGRFRWTICALLFFATTVNYLDRQVLSLLQTRLAAEFKWTYTDYSNIVNVFQLTYAICLLFVGRIIDRLGTRWGYAIAIIIWSLAAMLHASAIGIGQGVNAVLGWIGLGTFSVSIAGFMVSRVFLALGEAGNFPAAIKATAEYFPKRERSLATGIFNSGANVGAILAPLTVPWIAANWGWEWAFIIIGMIGFVWLAFWLLIYEKPHRQKRLKPSEFEYIHADDERAAARPDAPIQLTVKEAISTDANLPISKAAGPVSVDAEKISWLRLFRYPQTWAFTFGKFMTDGAWWFFLFWLPAYLKEQFGLDGQQVMLPLASVYTFAMIGSICGGWFPVYFLRKGHQLYDGRMKAMLLIALFPLVILAAQPLGQFSFWFPVLLIGIGCAAHQAWSANIFTTVSDMFPKKAIGSVIGIGGMAGGIGSFIVTRVAGTLSDHYKALGHIGTAYSIMFTFSALTYLVAWIVMKRLVPKYRPITDL